MKPSERRKARRLATQAIYQWQMTKDNVADIAQQFALEQDTKGVDLDYFRDLLFGVSVHVKELDAVFSPYLSRPLAELDVVDKAVLRLATYELTRREDVPYRVVINEAIELAKAFAADESHRFVNGVLDKVIKQLKK
ncbi:N utilization substance protein B [Oceanisphaera litoralis]|uniref:Transcription antitermination protein NusB n=1 Tax=Oceanisphaera arctica TaxID=641510 RepID=A0A2P5TMK8_9GAMM|nr:MULTISPECIES: transcription antitermination factor NusB [Oceanisphaera]MBM7455239.1 N utilization substance protein B [Oceanisphaera litoralis]MDX1265866.1 transcription antitermination factor NusB [Oceanisphaera sp.]PPL16638.1 N utilization substance protein B [Oceanisphaera arctica]GHA21185.1 N utilization substance protein B [Oceanisphaera arctica]